MKEVKPILWKAGQLRLLDQRKLPATEVFLDLTGARDTAKAIRSMVVRGAPAIGVTAAFGMAMEARRFRDGQVEADFEKAAAILHAARPTAVNLAWALQRLRELVAAELAGAKAGRSVKASKIAKAIEREAKAMMAEDVAVNRKMGAFGAKLVGKGGSVLTHCNAGALATAGFGTAVGVIRSSWEAGRRFDVVATETRPFLQGARLTSYEFKKLGIPVTLVTDGMVGHLMQTGRIGSIVVGTDRTAANGDVCNKIGTYQIAVLAKRHGVPFYVAAPTSSIDLDCATGAAIPIEERPTKEVTHIGNKRVATEGINIFNPAFDVTPAELVTGIVTEAGVVKGNYKVGLAKAVAKARRARGA